MAQVIEALKYTEDHEWVAVEGNVATLGITDFAQSSLGDIVFVELPDENQELEATASFGVVESIKSVSDLYSPVSGKVVEKNTTLEQTPENINEDAFGSWLVKIEMSNPAELESLMDSKSYLEFCESNS